MVVFTGAALAVSMPAAVPLRAQAPIQISAQVRGRDGQAEQRPDGRAGTPAAANSDADGEVLHRRRLLLRYTAGGVRVIGGPTGSIRLSMKSMGRQPLRGNGRPMVRPREVFLMIRSVLLERFKLKTHMETREMPVFELVRARADGSLGPELRESTSGCDAIIAAVNAGGAPPARQPNEPPPCGAMRGPARVIAGGLPMAQFANMLTIVMADANGPAGGVGARLVIDKTGLSGRYAFTLAWTPEKIPEGTPPPGIPPIDPNGPPLVTALQEQLGLRLQPARSQLEVVVIDSIELPTPD